MSCTFPAICSASACEILSARDLPSNRTLCLLYGSGAERRVDCPWSTGLPRCFVPVFWLTTRPSGCRRARQTKLRHSASCLGLPSQGQLERSLLKHIARARGAPSEASNNTVSCVLQFFEAAVCFTLHASHMGSPYARHACGMYFYSPSSSH